MIRKGGGGSPGIVPLSRQREMGSHVEAQGSALCRGKERKRGQGNEGNSDLVYRSPLLYYLIFLSMVKIKVIN